MWCVDIQNVTYAYRVCFTDGGVSVTIGDFATRRIASQAAALWLEHDYAAVAALAY